jgi:hypothetical protein
MFLYIIVVRAFALVLHDRVGCESVLFASCLWWPPDSSLSK